MTDTKIKTRRRRIPYGRVMLGAMSILTLFMILKSPEVAIDHMQAGMKLSVSVVIPSLFPFMVASELIVLGGAATPLGKLFSYPARVLFGISGEGATALLLGTVCGFPVGTRTAVSLYRGGRISHRELSRLICFSNNPSSAFVISAVGATLFGAKEFGIVLYFITVLSSLLVGIAQNILLGRADIVPSMCCEEKNDDAGVAAFSKAVTSSAQSMLGICAFVIFFSTFTGSLGELLSSLGATQLTRAMLFSFFELTGGAAAAAGVRPITLGVLIASFAVGWSGLSVHFQMISICDGLGVPLGRYFLSKLCQGVLNAVFVWLYFLFFGESITFDATSVGVIGTVSVKGSVGIWISAIFFISLVLAALSRIKKRII